MSTDHHRGELDVAVLRDGDSIRARLADARFVGSSGDARLGEWSARDRAAYVSDTARKREAAARRESREGYAAMTLRDLRSLYEGLPAPQRAALLATVIGYLR